MSGRPKPTPAAASRSAQNPSEAKRSDGVGVVGAYAVARRRARRKNAYDRQFDKGRKIAEKLPPNPARYIAIISRFFLL